MTLSPADVKVIHAFLDKQLASSKHLYTNGHQLDGLWMGGSGIAVWSQYGRINVHDKGSKAAQQVQRKLVSIAPRNWFSPESSWALPSSAQSAAERRKNPAVYEIEDYAAHNLGKLWVTKDGRRIAVISKGGTMHGQQLIDYIPLNGYKLIGNDGSVKLPKHLFPEIKRLLGVVSNPGKARVAFKPGKKGGNASRGGERDSRHPDHPWHALAMIEAKPAVRAFSDARLAEELALSQAAPIEAYDTDAWARVLRSEAKRRGVKSVKQNPSFSVMHADGSLTPFANPRKMKGAKKRAIKNPDDAPAGAVEMLEFVNLSCRNLYECPAYSAAAERWLVAQGYLHTWPSGEVFAGRASRRSGEITPEGRRWLVLESAARPNPGKRAKNPRYSSGVYAETVRLLKRSRPVPLREASAPRIRASLGTTGHEARIEEAIVHANAAARAYSRALAAAYKKYGEQGPAISLIGQDHWPSSVKDRLRRAYAAFQGAQDAIHLHYNALGKRTPLRESPYAAKMAKAGYYGTGDLRA